MFCFSKGKNTFPYNRQKKTKWKATSDTSLKLKYEPPSGELFITKGSSASPPLSYQTSNTRPNSINGRGTKVQKKEDFYCSRDVWGLGWRERRRAGAHGSLLYFQNVGVSCLDMRYFHTSPCTKRKTSFTVCERVDLASGAARVRILEGCLAKNKLERRPSTPANWKLFFFRPCVGFQRVATTNNGARAI